MGLLLRQCYLLTPTFLAAIAFVWLMITFLDQITQSSFLISSLYFLQLKPVAVSWSSLALDANSSSALTDTYTIGLWNSCTNFANGTTSCSSPMPAYTFDYLAAIDLLGEAPAPVEALLPSSWTSTLATYHAAMIWLFTAYCAALCLVAAAVLAGLLAYMHSSVSPHRTAFLAWLAAIFATAASATATALFLMLRKVVVKHLNVYGLTAVLGTRLLAYSWAGSGFMIAAAIFWLFHCCRCDGLRRELARDRERRRQRNADSEARSGQYAGQSYPQTREPGRGPDYEPLSGWQTGRPWSQASPGADDKLPMPSSMPPPMGSQPQWYGQRGSTFEQPMYTGRRVWIGGMGGMGGMGSVGSMGSMGSMGGSGGMGGQGPFAMRPVMVWEQNMPPFYM